MLTEILVVIPIVLFVALFVLFSQFTEPTIGAFAALAIAGVVTFVIGRVFFPSQEELNKLREEERKNDIN